MLYKLAYRNAKRSLSDYAVYLITVTLSFSLMFSFGLVASSDAISNLSEGMDTFQMILDFINIIILFVICFLINYTTKFMFTKRSREFGMYLLLGIRRGKVILIFLTEILLLGLFALILSLPAGFVISQLISMIIVRAFGIPEMIFVTFDPAPAGMLVLYFAAVCLLVLLNMARKMRRMSIRGFLDLEKENEKKMLRSSQKRNLCFCLSLLLGILGFLVWNSQFDINGASDQYVRDLEPVESHLVIDTEEETTADLQEKIVKEMSWHLTYTNKFGDVTNQNYKVTVRGQIVEEGNSMLAIVSSLCLYLAFIFLSTAGTILAVQALSDASRHKYRYTVLSRLGVNSTRLYRTVGKQLLILFGLPVVYPVIITFLCMVSINRLYRIFLENSWIYLLYFLAGLGIFLLVYLIYFIATYVGFKRNIQET